MICNTVLDALGNTPLIRLNRLTGPEDAEVLVKFEGLNVGGSIKTRTAFQMIEAAEKEGIIGPDTVIVEPTSGNQGIGLALVGAVKGYKVIIIMPDSVSKERRMLVRQYGAEVRLVHDRNNIGECIEKCIEMAQEMGREDPNVFIPNQFENYNNIEAHLQHTALEILDDMDGQPIHAFCSGVGTGGTLSGIGKVLKEANPDIAIVACEPDNAAILSGSGPICRWASATASSRPFWTRRSTTTSASSPTRRPSRPPAVWRPRKVSSAASRAARTSPSR